MFGYLSVDAKSLSKEDRLRYRRAYCGLCGCLGDRYGKYGSAALAYDMVFLILLLSPVYRPEETSYEKRCLNRPFSKCLRVTSRVTEYAADMNVLLSYYQKLDDWRDARDNFARMAAKRLSDPAGFAAKLREEKYDLISGCINELNRMEKSNELNPDLPANCFGAMLGGVFDMEGCEWSPSLRLAGECLGRFIYLLDAWNDLGADIKRERYNPLVSQTQGEFYETLSLLASESVQAIETLPLGENVGIIRNILYSGVWMKSRIWVDRLGGRASRSERGFR